MGPMALDGTSCRRKSIDSSSNSDTDGKEVTEEVESDGDSCGSCSSNSTVEADDDQSVTAQRKRRQRLQRHPSETTATVAAATAYDLLDVQRLPDLLDPERLVAVLDGCLKSDYVRGCVVETWDTVLSDHLEAIANLVLYQTPEHVVSQAVFDQLIGLSGTLKPQPPEPARVDAERVYDTLRSAARSLLATRAVDVCCRQNMCRAVGLAVAALQANTRPVFSVENFLVEINEAANFANLYCTGYAKRICAVLKDIYDAVMAGEYHPTGVVVQMSVMEKSIRAALQTLTDVRATAQQKNATQRSLLAELDGISATVRMKNHGCLDAATTGGTTSSPPAPSPPTPAYRSVVPYFTMSPWRVPIRMYHQQSPASVDQLLKTTVHLVEMLVSEMFKPCLDSRQRLHRRQRLRSNRVHDKQL